MPELNGFEVCEQLKADEVLKEIPVIFITALTEIRDKVMAFSVGAVDYITKPFQVEEIEARVRTHLKIRSLQRQLRAQNEDLERQVAERTHELAQANEQLLEINRLKDDFLAMISHEIRTPANGVLGIGELILDLCPISEEKTRYKDIFHESSTRLLNLIDDTTMIANLEKFPRQNWTSVSFSLLLDKVKDSLAKIRISVDLQADLKSIFIQGDPELLEKALGTIILLANSFSRNKGAINLMGATERGYLRIHIDLDALSLSEKAIDDFFDVESLVRTISAAESLGLAPVVAYKIISAFGGELRLIKGKGDNGFLEAILATEKNHS
jgi:signal transduction histidine kinase